MHTSFLEEKPPKKTQVSNSIMNMIKHAQHNIRIIQPYVTNIDELEDLLIEAMDERQVKVEIITARKRDQPCY
jgi:phosphatidylserine/phosphatidylglycerophosphate/cardiolipin synthase-like enzyme